MGFVGGSIGYRLLKAAYPRCGSDDEESPYNGQSKLEAHLGPSLWSGIQGKKVIDFGCGDGSHTIELARGGAAEVTGLDIRDRWFEQARRQAKSHGVADRCWFGTKTERKADVVLSLDSFEHFGDPSAVLEEMSALLAPNGQIWISFGYPWYHPRGGHLFSVFPWAHLIFTEAALIRWRSDFKSDGATRFGEVEGGLNQMSISRFDRIVEESGLRCVDRHLVPVRVLRWLHNPVTEEFTTALVQCRLQTART